MRAHQAGSLLKLRAIAGTHVVTLAWDLVDPLDIPPDLLGFAIEREEKNAHMEVVERYWLRGIKRFKFKDEGLAPGSPVPTSEHPVQSFQWGDFWPQFFSSTLENWQSEFLQLVWQAIGLSLLFLWGSSQSKESDERMEAKLDRAAVGGEEPILVLLGDVRVPVLDARRKDGLAVDDVQRLADVDEVAAGAQHRSDPRGP